MVIHCVYSCYPNSAKMSLLRAQQQHREKAAVKICFWGNQWQRNESDGLHVTIAMRPRLSYKEHASVEVYVKK